MKKLFGLLLALALCLSCFAAFAEGEVITVKMGVIGENTEYWDEVNKNLEDDGIFVELIKFSDYAQPNQALADGEIDLNSFQHYAFLNNWMASSGIELTPIGNTLLAPLGLYSAKITSLDELKEGDSIALMNDATNEGRAIKLLEQMGLITLKEDAGTLPELVDIVDNPLGLVFYEVDAAATPRMLQDVTAGFVNGAFAVDAGFVPEDDAIFLESQTSTDGSQNPYVNIIVSRPEDAENEVYLKVVEAFQQANVAQVFKDVYLGAYVPGWDTNTEAAAE